MRLTRHPVLTVPYAGLKQALRMAEQRALYRRLREVRPAEGGPRVVVHLGPFRPTHIFLLESYLAAKLNELGAEAYVLFNDIRGPLEDGMDAEEPQRHLDLLFQEWLCKRRVGRSPLYRYASRWAADGLRPAAARHAEAMAAEGRLVMDGVDLEGHVYASVVRYYRSAPGLVEREPGFEAAYRSFLERAALNVLLAREVEQRLAPDVVVTSHGIYTAWGPFYEYFKQRGRRAVVYGLGKRERGSIRLSNEGLVATKCDDGFFTAHADRIDVRLAEEAAAASMAHRVEGRMMDVARMDFETDDGARRDVLRWLGGEKAVALFPNVLWDASLSRTDRLFASPVDWVLETVRHFLERGDLRLIVRAHPAEARIPKMKPRLRVEDLLRERLGPAAVDGSRNVFFVPAEAPLKSYALFDVLRAGTTYNGTIGMELMYNRIPALVAGECHYAGYPFCTRFESRADYFAAFDRPERILSRQETHRELLVKYIYYFFNLAEVELRAFEAGYGSKLVADPDAVLADAGLTHAAATILGWRRYYQSINLPEEQQAA